MAVHRRSGDPSNDPQGPLSLSLVAPVRDEAPNLDLLIERCIEVLDGSVWRGRWEFVLVDDASVDASGEILERWTRRDSRIRLLRLERNAGQSAALARGLRASRGDLRATLDADLQNDPADLLPMLELLRDCDAVVGWRRVRRDGWLKRSSSKIANRVRNRLTRDDIRDTGCGLKVFRSAALDELVWFDGAHRFLPTLLRMRGARVLQHPVSHHSRVAGRSKYGLRNRAVRTLFDVFGVRWLQSRALDLPAPEARSLEAFEGRVPQAERADSLEVWN